MSVYQVCICPFKKAYILNSCQRLSRGLFFPAIIGPGWERRGRKWDYLKLHNSPIYNTFWKIPTGSQVFSCQPGHPALEQSQSASRSWSSISLVFNLIWQAMANKLLLTMCTCKLVKQKLHGRKASKLSFCKLQYYSMGIIAWAWGSHRMLYLQHHCICVFISTKMQITCTPTCNWCSQSALLMNMIIVVGTMPGMGFLGLFIILVQKSTVYSNLWEGLSWQR